MRKSPMLAPAYARLLSDVGAARLTPQEVEERDILVIARDENLNSASYVIDQLISEPDAPRTIPVNDIPTHTARLNTDADDLAMAS